jgi:ABC-2 type transport system ATP-binding protein
MTPAILCRELKKTYRGRPPVEAVRGVDLEVRQGECFGVLGPNGAGKTTTIEILEGLLAPTSGEVRILGHTWNDHPDQIRQRIGVSLQETQLSERISVLETLTLFRSFYRRGISPQLALKQVSLEEKAKSWIKKLSGGQKQRLAVACALVGDPELLFLDEPTTGLDPASRRELWEILRNFRARGRTILLTTHYMDEAERLCDRVAIVDHGRVIALGPPAELIAALGAEHFVEFTTHNGDPPVDREQLETIPGVAQADFVGGRYQLRVQQLHAAVPRLVERLANLQVHMADLTTRSASLEDVFVQLTGRQFESEESS